MSTAVPGTCRHCGCHGESCTLPNGDKCGWTGDCTVCNRPGCLRAELARVRAAKPVKSARSQYAGWGYGAIAMDLRKQRRRRRKKAA
jgi:hypothetical protein